MVPPDPVATLPGPHDPELLSTPQQPPPPPTTPVDAQPGPAGVDVLAAVMVAEVVLWTVARFVPVERAVVLAAAIPMVGLLGWLIAGVRARPRIGETALAVDAEGALGDRVSSALELAVAFPTRSGRRHEDPGVGVSEPADEAAETDRFVRRQRRDALRSIDTTPAGLFRPRFSQAAGNGRIAGGPSTGACHVAAEPAGRGHRPAAAGP